MWKKEVILNIKNVYTANAFRVGDKTFIGAGSETGSEVFLYDLKKKEKSLVADCPGGMMSFVPVPGASDLYASIMGLFPPFKGLNAGVYLHQRMDGNWITSKAFDLPFAHRCDFLSRGDRRFLFAVSCSQHKEDPTDWSKPGDIHLIEWDNATTFPLKSKLIDSSITRNHGLLRHSIDGQETLLVSGREGIFYFEFEAGNWMLRPLLEREVSEMTLIDLDGDGNDELITIEPFHGEKLNIYKKVDNQWVLKYSDKLSFGHGLSSGMFNGEPLVIVGNRRGSLTLDVLRAKDLEEGIVEREQIEKEAGPTQTQVFAFEGKDYIMSANQLKNEVALYSM